MSLDRMGEKSAGKIVQNIDRSRQQPLWRVLNGLGIPFVGERTAQILADHFGSLDAIAHADTATLQQADEVGPKVAHAILQFFAEERNRELVERLRAARLQFTSTQKRKNSGKLAGLTFVITGTLPTLSRDEAKQRIESAGGKVAGSVSKKTAYVFAGKRPGRSSTKQTSSGCP